jgi:hypothetical protein
MTPPAGTTPPPPNGKQIRGVVVGALALIIAVVIISFLKIRGSTDTTVLVIAIILIGVAVLALVLVPFRASALAKLRRQAPGQMVFTLLPNKIAARNLSQVFSTSAAGEEPPMLRGRLGASADASGISIWNGNPLHLAGHIPWRDVTDVSRGQAVWAYTSLATTPNPRNNSAIVPIVRVKAADGTVITVSLQGADPSVLPVIGSSMYVGWIEDQLNSLRTAAS